MNSTRDWEELRPLREALLAAARREADALVAAASASAEEILDAARQGAAERIASGRAEGAEEARRSAAAELAAARLQARSIVLEARSSVDDELRALVLQRVRELRDDVMYDRLRIALQRRGRALLGDAAVWHEPAGGGVVVAAAGRRVDASLDALAQWAAETASADAEATT